MSIKEVFNKLILLTILYASTLMNFHSLAAQEINEDTRFDHAKILYQKGLYLAARDEFSKLKSVRYEVEVKYYIASAAVKAGQNDGEYLIKEFVKDYPWSINAQQAFYELGNYYFLEEAYEKAIRYYNQSKTSHKDELNFNLGYSYFKLDRFDDALVAFGELEGKATSYEKDAGYFQGFIYYDRNDFNRSYPYLKKAFDSEAYKEDALMIYVSALYQLEKYQDLIELVETEMPETSSLMIINYLADAHYALKSYDDAKGFYSTILKKATYRTETNYFKAGYSCYKIKDEDEAINYLKRAAVADDTVGAYASYYLGLIYHGQKNLPFAVTAFGNTAKYDTQLKQDAFYHQSRTLIESASFQEAIGVITTYNEEFPKGLYVTSMNEMLSAAYSHTNNYDLAMQYIERLPNLTEPVKSVYQRVTFIKAMELFNDKKFKESAEIFQKSLIYNSDHEITQQSFYWMGECLSILKNDKDALFYYRSVKNGNPELYQKATYGLGYAYFNRRNYDDALVTFLKLKGGEDNLINQRYYVDGLQRIADCHFALKSYEKGIQFYSKAIDSGSKKKGQIYFQIGLLYRYLDDEDQARKYFLKLIKEVPSSSKMDHAHFQLAEIDFKTGKEQEAIIAYDLVLSKYSSSLFVPYALLSQAVVYDNMGNSAASIKNFKEILNRFPRHETSKSALVALQSKNANGELDEFDKLLAMYKAANPNSEALENIEFENARVAFNNQKYEQAIVGFKEFIRTYPASALLVDARYYIGDAYYRSEDTHKSLEAFYAIAGATDYSKHNRVLYRIAELESARGNFDKSNAYYYKMGIGGVSARNQIFMERGLMGNYLSLEMYDSVKYYGNSLLGNARTGVLVEALANLALGKAYYQTGDFKEAQMHLISLVSNSPDENGAEANYYVSKIYFDQKDYEKALESLFSLANNFKNYEKWVGKAFLLMADVYLNTDEVFQAKATLNSLISQSEMKDIVSEAKAKLVVIESMDKNEDAQNQ